MQSAIEETTTVAAEAAKAAPPVAVSVANTVFGLSLSDFLIAITIIYTVLQIYVLVMDRIIRKKKREYDDA